MKGVKEGRVEGNQVIEVRPKKKKVVSQTENDKRKAGKKRKSRVEKKKAERCI